MAIRGIGAPNVLVIGDGNLRWDAPLERSSLDREYEKPLHDVRALARRSRTMLAANDNHEKSAHSVYVVSDTSDVRTALMRVFLPSTRCYATSGAISDVAPLP